MSDAHLKATARGFYSLKAIDSVTGAERDLGSFENLILDAGLERIGSGSIIDRCQVGSGSTAPVVTDTALQTLVAATTTIQTAAEGAQSTAPYFGWYRWTFRFAVGTAAGNLSEVGVGWSGGLFSRALIKDSGGTPTTITVLSTEFLDVTYELRLYPPTTDSTFTTVIGGVTHSCTLRAANVTSSGLWTARQLNAAASMVATGFSVTDSAAAYNGSLGAITAGPTGLGAPCSSLTDNAYSAGSLTKSGVLSFTLGDGNLSGGISALLLFTRGGAYQVSFSPPIAKDNTKTLAINVQYTWARGA